MKRRLNTSYRLVWNETLGIFVAVSELTRSHCKKTGVILSLGVAALAFGSAVQAANTEIPPGETINGSVINGDDYQIVYGQANNTVIQNGGNQIIEDGGVAENTIITGYIQSNYSSYLYGSDQTINSGGNAINTTVTGTADSRGECMFKRNCDNKDRFITASQSLSGFQQYGETIEKGSTATGTVLNAGGTQHVEETATAIGTIINANGHQQVYGGVDEDNIYYPDGLAVNTVINAGGAQSLINGGHATGTIISTDTSKNTPKDTAYQIVIGSVGSGSLAENTTINNGGLQFVSDGGRAVNSIINHGGMLSLQVENTDFINSEGEADNEYNRPASADGVTVNNGGILSVGQGTFATDVTMNDGGALVASTASTVTGTNSQGKFSINAETGKASNVRLENGGRLDVLTGDVADTTTVDKGGVLAVNSGGTSTNVTINEGGALIADSGSTVSGTNIRGEFSIDAASGNARGLWLENGGRFSVKAGAVAENTTVGSRGELNVGNGGGLSGTTSLTENANLTITGDVVSAGTIENAGSITFAPEQSGKVMARLSAASSDNIFTPRTLTTTNLVGQGGTINMNINLANPDFPADMLIINGGQATGKTWLNFTNAGDAGLGLATTGDGIKVVDAINGATTDAGAFALGKKLQAGAYNYVLNHGTADENWYLSSEAGYRAEVALYASLFAQSMDYDRALAGSYSQRSAVKDDSGVWGRIQGGHMGHDNNGGIAHGATPESSGSYGFVQLGGDLLSTSSMNAGVYAAAGHSSVDVKEDDRSRAGTVRDDVYSLGGYLTAVHANSGLWADVVAQGSRHNLKASSDADSFDTHGWGWLASLETGLPFNITNGLVLEPQLQYIWQGLSLNNGHDNGGYVNFSDGSAQHLRAGLRFGSQSALIFGNGTSTQAAFGDSMKHRVSELPVNWWVRPSVIRTFSTDGDLHMGTTTEGSNVTFTPSQNGTSVNFQAGIDALIRQNVTLGIQGGYTRSVSGNSADGYNGQATLKVVF